MPGAHIFKISEALPFGTDTLKDLPFSPAFNSKMSDSCMLAPVHTFIWDLINILSHDISTYAINKSDLVEGGFVAGKGPTGRGCWVSDAGCLIGAIC